MYDVFFSHDNLPLTRIYPFDAGRKRQEANRQLKQLRPSRAVSILTTRELENCRAPGQSFNYFSLRCSAAQSDDAVPAPKAPVQRKPKAAAPKKPAAARKPAAKKSTGIWSQPN